MRWYNYFSLKKICGVFFLFKISIDALLSLCYGQDWCWYLEDVYFLYTSDQPDWVKPKHVLENEKDKTLQLTPNQEYDLINGQIQASEVCLLFDFFFYT